MAVKIRVFSDYVCPYCLLAKVPLEQALEGREYEIEWIPYELIEEPKKRVDIYNDPVRRNAWEEIILPASEKLGIGMCLPNVVPRPYTRLAFEGYHFAKEVGMGDEYNSRIYKAYFVQEQDIGSIEVLTNLADEIGLDADAFRQSLMDGSYAKIQQRAVRYGKDEVGVTSVPTIFIGNTKVDPVFSKEEFEELLNQLGVSFST